MHANVEVHGIATESKMIKTKTGMNMLAFNVEVTREYKGQLTTKIIPVTSFSRNLQELKNGLDGNEVIVKGTLTSKPNEYQGTVYYRLGVNATSVTKINTPKRNPLPINDEQSFLDEIPF